MLLQLSFYCCMNLQLLRNWTHEGGCRMWHQNHFICMWNLRFLDFSDCKTTSSSQKHKLKMFGVFLDDFSSDSSWTWLCFNPRVSVTLLQQQSVTVSERMKRRLLAVVWIFQAEAEVCGAQRKTAVPYFSASVLCFSDATIKKQLAATRDNKRSEEWGMMGAQSCRTVSVLLLCCNLKHTSHHSSKLRERGHKRYFQRHIKTAVMFLSFQLNIV